MADIRGYYIYKNKKDDIVLVTTITPEKINPYPKEQLGVYIGEVEDFVMSKRVFK